MGNKLKKIVCIIIAFAMVVTNYNCELTVFAKDSLTQAVATLYWPVRNSDGNCITMITSHNGGNHRGIDIGNAYGCGWYAACDGVIERVFTGCTTNYWGNHSYCNPSFNRWSGAGKPICNDGFGNGMVIRCNINGTTYYVQYAHMSYIPFNKNDIGKTIKRGTYIGNVGDTGNSRGIHAHFEINEWSIYGNVAQNDPERPNCIFAYDYGKLNSKPAKPGSVTIKPSDVGIGDAITASWSGANGATSYKVRLLTTSNSVIQEQNITGTSASFSANNSGNYKISVAAVNYAGESEASISKEIKVHNNCKVTYKDWDGKVLATNTVKYGTDSKTPVAPSREGYTFQGWSANGKGIKSDCVITAQYTINVYTVKFVDYTGSTIGNVQKVKFGDAANAPTNVPTKAGYKFSGWSTQDYNKVSKNLTVQAVYVWENENLPINVKINSAVRNPEATGYNVSIHVNNFPSDFTKGKIVTSLRTKGGKMVASEITSISMPASGEYDKSIFVLYSGVVSYVEVSIVGVVDDETTGTPKSKVVSATCDLGNKWSDWSDKEPPKGEGIVVETRTEYCSKTKKVIKDITQPATPKGYSFVEKKATGTYTNYGAWSGWMAGSGKSTTLQQVENRTGYRFYAWKCSSCGTQDPLSGACSRCGASTYWIERYEGASGYSYNYSPAWNGCTVRGKVAFDNAWWYFEYNGTNNGWTGTGQPTIQQYRTRNRNEYYNYWFITTEFSQWQPEEIKASDTVVVKTRTAYRYKSNSTEDMEDKTGIERNISGKVDGMAGKRATLMIYKGNNTDPTSSQLEYIEQTVLGSDGEYSFSFITKEEPSLSTGDFIVNIGVEGATYYQLLDKIKAPKPIYKVDFANIKGDLICETQNVTEGESAVAPQPPVVEGYDFVGWDTGLSNVHDNLLITAQYQKRKCTVVFVDDESYVEIKTFDYGDELKIERIPSQKGKVFDHWVNERGDTVTNVVDNMVLKAVYRAATYTVSFLDWDGNEISTQEVGYLDEAITPTVSDNPKVGELNKKYTNDMIFDTWDSYGDEIQVARDMIISPVAKYKLDAGTPKISISDSSKNNKVKVTIKGTGRFEKIYYYVYDSQKASMSNVKTYSKSFEVDKGNTVFAYATGSKLNQSNTVSTYIKENEKNENVITAKNIVRGYSAKAQKVKIKASSSIKTKLTYKSNSKKIKVNSKGMVTIPKKFEGTATVTITAKATGNYKKTTKKIKVIVPKGITIAAKSSEAGCAKITWKKVSSISGYEIRFSKNKAFSNAEVIDIGKKDSSCTISVLESGRAYYFSARSFVEKGGKRYYSKWNNTKKVIVK